MPPFLRTPLRSAAPIYDGGALRASAGAARRVRMDLFYDSFIEFGIRKAKGERRKAKGERRKAKGERRKAKGDCESNSS